MGNNAIQNGYVVENDDEVYHDPLAGTVDPVSGMRYATDEEIREAINDVVKAMNEYELPPEEKERIRRCVEETEKCATVEEREQVFNKYFPEHGGFYLDEMEVPDDI